MDLVKNISVVISDKPATDGITVDNEGNIWMTAIESSSIVVAKPVMVAGKKRKLVFDFISNLKKRFSSKSTSDKTSLVVPDYTGSHSFYKSGNFDWFQIYTPSPSNYTLVKVDVKIVLNDVFATLAESILSKCPEFPTSKIVPEAYLLFKAYLLFIHFFHISIHFVGDDECFSAALA